MNPDLWKALYVYGALLIGIAGVISLGFLIAKAN